MQAEKAAVAGATRKNRSFTSTEYQLPIAGMSSTVQLLLACLGVQVQDAMSVSGRVATASSRRLLVIPAGASTGSLETLRGTSAFAHLPDDAI